MAWKRLASRRGCAVQAQQDYRAPSTKKRVAVRLDDHGDGWKSRRSGDDRGCGVMLQPPKDRLKDKGHAVKRRGEESVSPFAHSWDIRTTILYW